MLFDSVVDQFVYQENQLERKECDRHLTTLKMKGIAIDKFLSM